MRASSGVPKTASDMLPFISKESLLAMGRFWGLDNKTRSKEELVAALSPLFADPARVAGAVRSLAPRERAALDALILNGGRLSVRALQGQLQSEGLVDARPPRSSFSFARSEGSPSRADSRRFEDILARLGALGLAFPWPPSSGSMLTLKSPATTVVIPRPILEVLPPVTVTVLAAPEPAVVSEARPDILLRDLLTVLGAVRREPVELTVRGLIPKRSLVKLARLLSVPESDLGYPSFVMLLARAAGLIVTTGGKLREGTQTESFLERSRGERLRQLYEAYVSDEQWSELTRIAGVAVRGTTAGAFLVRARRRVLDVVRGYGGSGWIRMDDVVNVVRRTAYEFLIPRERNDPYGYYRDYPFNPYTDGNLLGVSFDGGWEESEGWNRVEGGFIRAVVSEPLFWLGLVDLGAAASDAATDALRVTDAGAALLRGRIPDLPQLAANVVIQPNFQILAFEPTGEDVLFRLERLADRVSAQQVVEYRITRDSIYRAQQGGMEAEEILSFLDTVSTVPIPQNVRRSIEEWAAQTNRIVLRRHASLLQTLDEATLDSLYARGDTAPLLGKRVAPCAALVPYDNLEPLNARLTADGGPMPALSEGNDAQLGGGIRVDDGGTITFTARLPSIHLQQQVRAVAEPDGDGTYRLTRASLRLAARKLGPDDIGEALSHFQGAPLSDEVVALIHRWTKNWGSAALAEVLLLQVESGDILESLLAAPELRPYLQRLPGASTAALVSRKGLATVRAALEERGMELSTEPVTAAKR